MTVTAQTMTVTASDDNVKVTLQNRGKTHGAFSENADIALALRADFRACSNWNKLKAAQRLALDEIALKLARILSAGSQPDNPEHWLDIAGYATLGKQACDTESVKS